MRGPQVRFCERRGGVILRAYSTRRLEVAPEKRDDRAARSSSIISAASR
jgi:hypothetical protein